ncbi:MAG: HAD family hydrolase [Haloferacaceae archaeon]
MPTPIDDYDFWLFDLDGTLVDVEWSYVRETFDQVGDRLGRPFTDAEAETVWHGLSGTRDEQLRDWDVDPRTFWRTLHEAEDARTRAEATYLHDDAAALVSELDVPVGVVTHCPPSFTGPVLDHLGVRDWFDTVVCCSDELGWKPDAAPVERAMANIGVGDDSAGVLAGDSENDVGAAWNADLDGIHVERHDPRIRGRCVLGDYRVRSFGELRAPARTAGSD